MKRRLLVASAFILTLSPFVRGQEAMDAYKLSQTELTGTARSMSMGGAFGALGGDVSAIAINPAGIGVYKSSEIVTTLNFQNRENKASSPSAGSKEMKKFRVNFNNLAFVTAFPLYNDAVPLLNVGFSYNRLQSFDRRYSTNFGSMDRSLADNIAEKTYGQDPASLQNGNWVDTNWLSFVGYGGYLIQYDGRDGKGEHQYMATNDGMGVSNMMNVREKGSVNSYDFNLGTTIEDILSVGLSVSITDIDYKMSSFYSEDFRTKDNQGGFDLVNDLKTEGTGWKLGLGVILKPIEELRIGIAYHTPTWYRMTDYSDVFYEHNFTDIITEMHLPQEEINKYEAGYVEADRGGRYNYKLRTPDKWVFSLAGVLGGNAILSLDYELIDYKKAKFNNRGDYYYNDRNSYDGINRDIKDLHRLSSTIRVGGEYRFTPQFSGRVGYQWQQSPYEDLDPDRIIYTAGSVHHFVVSGDKQYVTCGLGYRFTKNIYTDIAFVYRTQDSDLYFFDGAPKTDLKEKSFQGALTLGFRF